MCRNILDCQKEWTSRLEEENVKEILHDVLNELYYSKKSKEDIQKSQASTIIRLISPISECFIHALTFLTSITDMFTLTTSLSDEK